MRIDTEAEVLIIGDKTFNIENEDKFIRWVVEMPELLEMNFTISDFHNDLVVQTTSIDGFGSYLFHDFEFFKSNDAIQFVLRCNQPNKYWERQWGLSTFLVTLADIAKDSSEFEVDLETLSIDDDWKSLEITFKVESDFSFSEIITKYSNSLKELINRTELVLSGAIWKKEYDVNESLFCTEIIFPLLRKMGFLDVRFSHGVKEYGKDFTFSELTKFGNLRHFALQAKAGNMRGNVNSDIDEIIGQLNDAFTMPYFEISATETRHISIFIIAISGYFTDNAKDKIIQKIPPHFKGCVYLLDKDKIMELIEKYWK
ncbi:MAG: hypothetical protein Q8T08_17470 [Ignavibacteria bacterium]|nr:hypothetical protein [Ignavibacteria bacterium]